MRYLAGGKPTPHAQIESQTLPRFLSRCGQLERYAWAAVEKASGEFLGWFALRPMEGGASNAAELGYRLRRPRRKTIRTLRTEPDRPARATPCCPFPPCPRPFSLFLRVKKDSLTSLLSAARICDPCVSIRWRKSLDISQDTCAWNDLGGSDRESLCYGRLGGNSSRAIVNSRVSSAHGQAAASAPSHAFNCRSAAGRG